jgi:hypothetical protein
VDLVRTDVWEKRVALSSDATLIVTANVVPITRILSTLKMEAKFSSETSCIKRLTLRHIPEDGILHSHRRENLKSHTHRIYVYVCLINVQIPIVAIE